MQNEQLVETMVGEVQCNVGVTAPKNNADSEKDAINTERYKEDKILLLLLCLDRRNASLLSYLLD